MLAKELLEWAQTLPPEARVQVQFAEMAKKEGWTNYTSKVPEDGGWVALTGETLRVVIEHPERRPAQVADRLLREGE